MDKNAIKKYAVWARRELISRVSTKAAQYEITADGYGDPDAASVLGRVLSAEERKQRSALITRIREKGYEQVMEEITYTWFNRFIALRFMEVNGYLPSRVRVFTDDSGAFKPQILTEAIDLDLEGLDMEKVYALKNANDNEALYKYLLITQCNALSPILPGMFQKIADYTEILFPDNLLREGSVVEQMIAIIPEEDFTDQVQILGWLYQYYNSEKKDDVFAALKKNVKITKENIPAATQLFTPDWIVRYMVENSLGRLWVEGHPNDELKATWKYYLEEAEQEPDVQAQLQEIRREYATMNPEDIKVIDPCCGSGHILCYLFDVLMQIYESQGYTPRDAVQSILQNNLHGLDIDKRAAQLAYFSVMMKARQYDRRVFSRGITPQVYCPDGYPEGEELGSIIVVDELEPAPNPEHWTLLEGDLDTAQNVWNFRRLLVQKYDVVVTNPPYMASSGMDSKLFSYVKEFYDDGRNDLYTVFILKCCSLAKTNGYIAMITQLGWMSLTRSTRLRDTIYTAETYINMVHLGSHLFEEISGEVVKTGAFILGKFCIQDYQAIFCKVDELSTPEEKEAFLLKNKNLYHASLKETYKIEGAPLSYWLPRTMLPLFSHSTINTRFICRAGMQTGNNEAFLRFWYEPSKNKLDCFSPGTKWFGYNKGGSQRKWYGNTELVVNWENNGADIKAFKKRRLELGEIEKKNSECWNSEFYFVEGATWSSIASGAPMFRYTSEKSIFDIKGPTCFAQDHVTHDELLQVIGFLNSPIVGELLHVLSPTLDCNPGTVSRLPYIPLTENPTITTLVEECIALSKNDWDSFETSWDFKWHPLMLVRSSVINDDGTDFGFIDFSFRAWQQLAESRFNQLKANEEELNRIFIDIYGLQDELTPEVEDKDVTVRKADLTRDIKSFISYAVGCMFGRYSLDVPGLAYAGGEWDGSKYKTFLPDKDDILPICDDEYFEDDIVGRFVHFVEVVYGKETLEENLKFIADALGGKGSPREVIRNYFLNDFYADHLKIYQKRPIYWLFDSGKKNGFKCLIYMHRYAPDTIARIRTDYVHEQQSRYRTAIADLQSRIANAGTSERVKLTKQLTKLQAQAEELRAYEEKIHHLADQMISIDLDDGVKVNYAKFQDVLAKIK